MIEAIATIVNSLAIIILAVAYAIHIRKWH